jgi:predicted SAM-dependent methyltransferase
MRPTRIYRLAMLAILLAILFTPGCDQAAAEKQQVAAPQPAQAQAPASALEQFQKNSPAVIERYVREHQIRKVQLGAGSSRLEGWLNTDIEPGDGLAYLDATKPFPFENDSVHYIFSEHVIEHLTYDEAKIMMAEAHRVLAPGGKMRISTPNLTRFIELFDETPSNEARAYLVGKRKWHEWPEGPNAAAIILNLQMSSWGHKFMYDVETLGASLQRAGFRNVREFEENISTDEHLRDLEERDSGVNARFSDYETMSVEAEKPGISTPMR